MSRILNARIIGYIQVQKNELVLGVLAAKILKPFRRRSVSSGSNDLVRQISELRRTLVRYSSLGGDNTNEFGYEGHS